MNLKQSQANVQKFGATFSAMVMPNISVFKGSEPVLKAVIFDMDGVLLDSESIHYEILRDMMARRGFSYTTEHLHRYCGVPEEQMWPQLLREAGLLRESPLALQREHWERYEWRIRSEGLPKFPGTKELLESLRDAGYRLAVASASPMALILRNLRENRLRAGVRRQRKTGAGRISFGR